MEDNGRFKGQNKFILSRLHMFSIFYAKSICIKNYIYISGVRAGMI